jgi:microcystin-dependent protein
MATITGLTAARMLEIEGESIIDGEIVGGNLILTKHDGTTINAGPVVGPPGPQGPAGPAAPATVSAIPGEVKLWPGTVLPDLATYGKWVWADGAFYSVATYPLAAANIAAQWKTFAGASDPGAGNFRVPDLRGLVAAGLDAMPGGTRANRMTRAVAITIAAKTGEETHVVLVNEMPAHAHGVNDPGHGHYVKRGNPGTGAGDRSQFMMNDYTGHTDDYPDGIYANATGISIQNNGGGGAHENVQPTVFVPYIVKLDG